MYFYVRYTVPFRDLEEIMAERGVVVDHATLNRWLVKFAPTIAAAQFFAKALSSNGIPLRIMIEQDHRFIKRRTHPMLGIKSFNSATATLEGIKVAQMIRKRQLELEGSEFVQFAALAG